ncbi:hypothetical protein NLX86_27450 [Streptomyces sp. A3M-1-3]|nr:hypothetical protein [Streptomyces sp. A3M-1-3]MCP3821693.1 hypothetical protein [Streptomyces sp. A3M-1-3]
MKAVLQNKPPVFGNMADPQPGDVLLFEEPAVDPDSGKAIGDSLTRVHVLKDGSFLLDCTVRLTDKGNLVFAGGEEFSNVVKKATFTVVDVRGIPC